MFLLVISLMAALEKDPETIWQIKASNMDCAKIIWQEWRPKITTLFEGHRALFQWGCLFSGYANCPCQCAFASRCTPVNTKQTSSSWQTTPTSLPQGWGNVCVSFRNHFLQELFLSCIIHYGLGAYGKGRQQLIVSYFRVITYVDIVIILCVLRHIMS